MNFGQKGRELLQELKQSDWLPLYSEDAVHRCILVSDDDDDGHNVLVSKRSEVVFSYI